MCSIVSSSSWWRGIAGEASLAGVAMECSTSLYLHITGDADICTAALVYVHRSHFLKPEAWQDTAACLKCSACILEGNLSLSLTSTRPPRRTSLLASGSTMDTHTCTVVTIVVRLGKLRKQSLPTE